MRAVSKGATREFTGEAINQRKNTVKMHTVANTACSGLLTATAALLLASCVTKKTNDPNAPSGPPDATLTLDISQASYYGSASSGGGRLNYQGRSYPISVKAVGGGGTGVQTIHATGEVYRLQSLAAFSGTYTGKRSGLTLFKGKMYERLESDKGTIIYLTGSTSGLASSSGIDKFFIKLKYFYI